MKKTTGLWLGMVGMFVILIATAMGAQSEAIEFYVATDGNDSWSGRLKAPDRSGSDGPFATLERAIQAVRRLRSDRPAASGPARIVLRGGVYFLKTELLLESRDSDLTIEGASKEKAALSGGALVTGWKRYRGRIMQADLSGLNLPDCNFRELYYNGKRQPLARVPNFDPEHPRTGGFAYNVEVVEPGSLTRFRYRPEEIDPTRWAHPERALVDFFSNWNYNNTISGLKSFDPDRRVLEVHQGCYDLQPDDRYFAKNIFEELDAPGEWYCDPDTRTLYFWPPDGRLAGSQVIIPALNSAFTLKGDASRGEFVERVRLKRLAIRDLRGTAVSMVAAQGCTVSACAFRNVMTAVALGDETHRCRVLGCDITQTGGTGISLDGTPEQHERVSHHLIDNNYIYDFGWVERGVGGISLSCVSHCTISHNHIHDGPRWGIVQNAGNNNTFAYNHLHHLNLETCDTGALYTVTCAGGWDRWMVEKTNRLTRGHEIHHNLIHDTGGYGKVRPGVWEYPHYCWGIYLDLASSGYDVHDNVVYNTYLGGFMIGGGQDNRCENNIFINGKVAQVYFCPWLGGAQMHSFPMERNRIERNIIIYSDPGAALYQSWSFQERFATFQNNLISSSGSPPHVAIPKASREDSWALWLSRGQDRGSLVADPLFIDPARHDYRLRPDSSAFRLGFKPIDLTGVGNYRSPDRYRWLRKEVKVYRERPVTRSSYRAVPSNPP